MIIKKAPPLHTRTQPKLPRNRKIYSNTKQKITNQKYDHTESLGPWIRQQYTKKKTLKTSPNETKNDLSSKGKQFILKSHRNRVKKLSIAFNLNPEESSHLKNMGNRQTQDEKFVRHADFDYRKIIEQKHSKQNNQQQVYHINYQHIPEKSLKSSLSQSNPFNKYYSLQLAQRKMSMNKFRTIEDATQKQKKYICKAFSNKKFDANKINSIDHNNKLLQLLQEANLNTLDVQKTKNIKTLCDNSQTQNLLFYLKARNQNNIMCREKNIMKLRNLMHKKSSKRMKTDGLAS